MSTTYADKLEAFRKSDAERDALVAQILQDYEDLKLKVGEISDDYKNEVASRRMWQNKAASCERDLEQALSQQKQVASTSNFAVVLIDGDGAIFSDYLYGMGKDGGAEAAHQLHKEVQRHLKAIYPDSNVDDWNIVVQVVLNLSGLAAKLQSCGIIMSPNELLAFGRSFGLAQPLFSFVDVGGGKERADHKLREHLRLYLRIGQCKHIFFAPCHDNGYLPVLESYRREHASRMTLIETRPAEPGYVELGLRRIQMPTLFRSDNLPGGPVKSMPTVALEAPKNFAGMPNAVLSPQPKKLPNRTGLSTQAQNAAIMPKSPSPAPSNESNGSSWATIGKNGGPTKTINIAPQKKPDRKFILVNRYNERIDEDLPRTDPAAENRFQKRTETYGKHCNSYHLLGRCERGEYCDYHHGEKLTAGERLVLKHKARSLSCPKKIACTDPICPYGHHCKYGGGHCYFDRCYYADTHTMDLEPAKKIYEDGSEEWLPNYLEKSR